MGNLGLNAGPSSLYYSGLRKNSARPEGPVWSLVDAGPLHSSTEMGCHRLCAPDDPLERKIESAGSSGEKKNIELN